MTQRTFIAAAFVTLIAAFPAAVPGGSPMSADQQPYTNAVDGYTYTYFDPVVISSDCVGSVDPLGCTAEADAGTLADDAAADALSPEGATEDGAVLDSPEPDASSSDSSALDSSSFDPSAADPFTYDSPWFDSQPALDPEAASSPLELSTIDPAPELDAPIQAEALAASVRPIVRGFNTRQEADYLGDGNTRRWDAAWAEIAGTHVRVHRLAVYWWDVQCRGADQWDFGKYIRVAEAARARNMRLILTPVGSPNWARSPGRQTPTKENPDGSHDPCVAVDASGLGIFAHPDNLNAWTQFIHHLALTFRPFNPIGYEIWNEENSRDFWDRVGIPGRTPQPPCPTCWTRYYCLATGQIDANDPGKAVGVGGLAAHHANQFVTVDGRR